MKNNLICIFIFLFCSLLDCQEKKNNYSLPFYNSVDDRNLIMPFLLKSEAKFIINLRHVADFYQEMKMIVIEYNSNKSFKVRYYWTNYFFNCANYEEIIKDPDSYVDEEPFDNNDCPSFANEIKKIIKNMIPDKVQAGIFLDAGSYELLLQTTAETIYIDRVPIGDINKKMDKIFNKAWKCLEKKYAIKKKN